MLVSIVVPTRDRPAALGRCLAALAGQDAGELEIIVVDDGSADAEAVERVVSERPAARLVRAGGDGPAAARNTGVAAALGDVVLFTDDDCEPHAGWTTALAAAAGDRPASGRTVNAAPGPAPAAAHAIASHLQMSSLSADRGSVAFAPTCNLGAPRTLLERLPFDESYPLAAGEDREWCARVSGEGARIAWEPKAVVRHRHAMGAADFLRQQARYGRGAARFRGSGPVVPEHRPRPSFYAGFVRAGLEEGPAAGALVCAGQLATAAGFALERVRSD